MRKWLFIILCCLHFNLDAQVLNVNNVWVTGHFNGCSGSNTPNVSLSFVSGFGSTFANGGIVCTDPCGTTTIKVTITNIKWAKEPGDQWLHGIFLPANSGYTVSGINLPAGFSTYNGGCTGGCPAGILTGPGFYYDATGSNSCCGFVGANDGTPCNNWGQTAIDCPNTFSLQFNLTFCNSSIQSTTDTFTLRGTGDGLTGCWSGTNGLSMLNTINFTVPTVACAAVVSTPFTASAVQKDCSGSQVNYTSTLSGGCSSGNTVSWWTAPTGGTQVGTGSPFVYDPPGNACPAGTTLYASCCTGGITNCIARTAVTIPGTCDPPLSISAVSSVSGDCITLSEISSVTVLNNSGTVNYTLNPGGITNSTGVFTGLSQASYTVTASDATNCTATTVVNFTPILLPSINVVAGNIVCNGDTTSITATASGTITPYTYSLNGSAFQAANTFNGLNAGVYTISTTDGNGCTASTIYTLTQPSAVGLTALYPAIPCFGDSTVLTVTGTGGTPGYQYNINGGPWQLSGIFNDLISGTYTVNVMDGNNCTGSSVITINQPALLQATVSNTSILCFGGTSTVTITATGGTIPSYQYNLSGSGYQTFNMYTNISAGTYTVEVYDGNNCTYTTTLTITQPPALTISTVNTPIACFGETSTLTVTSSGGTLPVEFAINGGGYQASNIFSGLSAGTYTVVVKDANGCTKTTTKIITEPPLLTLTVASDTVNCFGNTGTLQVLAGGGTPNYQYNLNGGPNQSNASFSGLVAGSYTLTVVDANGCTASSIAEVIQPTALTLNVSYAPLLCFGETTDIVLTATGGNTLSYQYNINGGANQASNTFPNQTAGTYTCTVIDGSGCTASTQIIISEPTQLELQALTNTILCFGGSAIVSSVATGGTLPYQYSLNNGPYQTSSNFPGQTAGVYTITVSDGNNCTATSTVQVTQPNALLVTASSSSIACSGAVSTITATASGGVTPQYQYSLNGSANQLSPVFPGNPFGSYTVQVTDGNNCTATTVINIVQPTALSITLSATPILCFAGATSILATPLGGTPNYQYSVNGGPLQSSNVITSITSGNYTVMVVDANNCTATSVITIAEPSALTVNASSSLILCFGNSSTITLTANGGTLPAYSYNLNGGALQSSFSFNGLAAGTYTAQVVDGNNCTATTVINITQPTALSLNQSHTPILCFGQTSILTAIASGGTVPAYQYNINGGAWQPSGIFNNLSAGTYTLQTQDGNGCTASLVVVISQPTQLNVTASAPSVACNGGITTIQVLASGGTIPSYQYSLNGGAYQSSSTFNAVPAGNYTITVMDGNNCTSSTTLTITEPPILTVTASAAPISCFGGTTAITASGVGGQGTLQYNINNATWQSSNLFNGLTAGTYSVFVKDANNCTASTVLIINQPALLELSLSAPPILCFNGTTVIQANATGGTVPAYQYNLNGGAWQAASVFNAMPAGLYTVTVQDANGCSATSSIQISQPNAILLSSIQSTTPTCIPGNDATLTVVASGGTPLLNYSLNGSAFQASNIFTGLGVSVYTITVQDGNNCTLTSTHAVTNPNSPVILSAGVLNASCFGSSNGSISVIATGSSALTYTILPTNQNNTNGIFLNIPANTYTVIVADASLCSASSVVVVTQPTALVWNNFTVQPTSCSNTTDGEISTLVSGGNGVITYNLQPGNLSNSNGLFTNLAGGSYTVTATDINGCTTNTVTQVVVPTAITSTSISSTNESCNNAADGSITIACAGGTGILTYLLNPGSVSNTTGLFTNLSGAVYTITVTDINGCSYLTQLEIINPPVMQFSAFNATDVLCVGNTNGTITAIASGGSSSTYTYTLQPGSTSNTTGNFSNLSVNSYTVTASDINGCTVTSVANIITPSPIVFTLDSIDNVSCFGGQNGGIYTSTSGGVAPYSYVLGPSSAVDSIGDYSNLSSGNYTVTVTDDNGCTLSISPIFINQPPALSLQVISQQNTSCYGFSDGTFTVAASGGTSNLNLTLLPAVGTFVAPGTFANLTANTYTVLATDANSCTLTTTINITQNPPVLFDSVVLNPPTCFGDMDGTIAIYGSGGSGNLTYQLNNFFASSSGFYNNLVQGTYTLNVSDDKGCFRDTVVNLIQPNPLEVSSLEVTPTECDENKNGKIIVSAAGGTPVYTYILRPQIRVNQTGVFIHLKANTYTLTIKDANGCEIDTLITILPPDKYMEITTDVKDMGCFGKGVEGEATANVVNGTPPYTYSWNSVPPQFTQTASGLKFGYYFLQVIDARGCIRYDTVYIKPGTCCEEIFIPNAFSPNGDGMNDVFRVTTSTGLEIIDFAVFNRWGVKVWNTYDLYRGWDGVYQGKMQDMGTYYYLFKYKCLYDGNTYIKKGDVILVH